MSYLPLADPLVRTDYSPASQAGLCFAPFCSPKKNTSNGFVSKWFCENEMKSMVIFILVDCCVLLKSRGWVCAGR